MEIPEIKVSEEKVILDAIISLMSEGPGSLEVSLNAKDGEPVECYQRRLDRPMGINRWIDIFYVTSRENLNIMWRLDKLLGWEMRSSDSEIVWRASDKADASFQLR